MCAINGITWSDESLVVRMNAVSKHRGKDATGVLALGKVTLGHNRLSVIDLDERSSQPMQDHKRRYSISYNGEIYNFKELREELSGIYTFTTESDTEVILAGYIHWGENVFSRLNGIFALAIYDTKEEKLILARDPIGVKPLYLYTGEKGYAFASEIKSLLEVVEKPLLDGESFSEYMHTLYVPGEKTLFKGISKFPKGTIGVLQNGEMRYTPFSFISDTKPLSTKDVSGLRREVCRAVRRQMVSDRPLGIYLSGGIDSSVVLACAVKENSHINTYSIGFDLTDDEEEKKFNADAVLAKKVSAYFGATHHEFFIQPKDVISLWKKAIYHLDEPIGNATIASQIALSEEVSKSMTVALTGDGGDEVFGGYPRYLLARRVFFIQKFIPKRLLQILPGRLKKLAVSSLEELFVLFHFQKNGVLSRVLNERVTTPRFLSSDISNIIVADRENWLVDEALLRSDKLSMAHSLESRAPLLDLALLAQVQEFPFEKQVTLFDTKVLLKRAFKNDLPKWLMRQPKRGWFSPGAKWLRHTALEEEFKEILSVDYAPGTSSLFNWNEIQKLFNEHKEKKAYHATALLSIVMFQLWAKEYNVSLE